VEYEWDEGKNALNVAKHGLDFSDAWQIFVDPNRITFVDDRKDYGEARFKTIGKATEEIIVSVCYTDRNGVVRVISLRKASRKEREAYYGDNQNDPG